MILFLLLFCLNLNASTTMLPLEQFGKKEIQLDGKKITAYIADNPDEQRQGLMQVKSLGPNEGMLFIFDFERPQTFWMKNTLISLSIGFFDKNKRLLETLEMTPHKNLISEPVLYQSKRPAQYVLEMNANWFSKNKIKVGSRLSF